MENKMVRYIQSTQTTDYIRPTKTNNHEIPRRKERGSINSRTNKQRNRRTSPGLFQKIISLFRYTELEKLL